MLLKILFFILFAATASFSYSIDAADCADSSTKSKYVKNNISYILSTKINDDGIKVGSVLVTPLEDDGRTIADEFPSQSVYIILVEGNQVHPYSYDDLTGSQQYQDTNAVFVGMSLENRETWFDLSSLNSTDTFEVNIRHSIDGNVNDVKWDVNVSCPESGECGSANGMVYPYDSTSYGSDQQCSVGEANDTRFPNTSGYIVWTCSGINGGDESQECRADRSSEPVESKPNLIISELSVSNTTPGVGSTFTIYATVKNTGNVRPGSTTLRYYRSYDSDIPDGDTQIGIDSVTALDPDGTSDEDIAISISSVGTYYIGVCVDSVNNESSTDDNCSSFPIEVTVVSSSLSVDSKICSEVNVNGNYLCNTEKSNFSYSEDIYCWAEFTELANGTYNFQCRMINESQGIEITTSSVEFEWIDYSWYRAYSSLSNQIYGDWKIEVILNNEVVSENYFSISPPSITSISQVTPQSAVSGSDFTFSCTLSDSLPTGYSTFINFGTVSGGFLSQSDDGGHVDMGSDCSLTTQINTVGERKFRIGIFDNNDDIVGSYSETGYFTVEENVSSQPPIVSLFSEPETEISLGSALDLEFVAEDVDGDLKTLEINYGDDPSNIPVTASLTGSSENISVSHTYSVAGDYEWSVKILDHAGNDSNTITGTVTIVDTLSIESIATPSPSSAVSGSDFTFSCTLSDSLPTGYSTFINFGTVNGGFLSQSDDGGHVDMGSDCSLTTQINTVGERKFRIGIFDNNDDIVGSYSETGYFTVEENVSFQPPIVSLFSEPETEISLGSALDLEFVAEDVDGDLKTLEINYGDALSNIPETVSLTGSSQNISVSHTYSVAGDYEWSVKIVDHAGNDSNTVTGTVTVVDNPTSSVLAVSIQGQGQVLSSPTGIDCGSDCSQSYTLGQSITLTASADASWVFSQWQGASSCSDNQNCSLTISEDMNVTAVFIEAEAPELEARLINFFPKSLQKGEDTQITLEGVNLPSTLVANIEGTNAYCSQESYSDTEIILTCNPDVVGDQRFYITDDLGSESREAISGSDNWLVTVSPPTTTNTAPAIWVDDSYKKYSYVNKYYTITAKSWDEEKNLKSIQVDWGNDGSWEDLFTVSNGGGEDVFFSHPVHAAGVLEIRFKAVDEGGYEALSEVYRVHILPESEHVVENTGSASLEETQSSGSIACTGNPITLANGGKVESRNLLSVNGALPLQFNIQYNSLIRGKSSVGFGWDFDNAYAARVIENTDGSVQIHWSENSVHLFNLLADGSYEPESYGCKLDTLEKQDNGQFKVVRFGRDTYYFNEFNFLNRIENEKGQGLEFSYNNSSQLVKVTDSISGKYIDYSYDQDGYLIQASTIGGRTVSLSYMDGRLTQITYPNAMVEEFGYTDLDQLTSRTIDGELITTTLYDEFGRAVDQDDAKTNNQHLLLNYSESNGEIITRVTDKNGFTRTYVFDSDYKLIREEDALGNTKEFEYTDGGRPTLVRDGNNNTTHHSYNQYGDLLTTIFADLTTETRTYDSRRNLIQIVDAYGNEENYTYDESNNLLTHTDKLGHTTTFTYDDNNQILTKTTPEGRTYQYSYTDGLLTSITNPKGDSRYLGYDTDGRLVEESDFLGNYTYYTLDEMGRKLSETDPLGNKQEWTYDPRGNLLTYVDQNGNRTTHEYNISDEKIATIKTDSDGAESIWQYEYDGESRLVKNTDPNGNSTSYERDALGRIVKEIDAQNQVVSYQYDANGNLTDTTDQNNQISRSDYDEMNRVTQIQDPLNHTTEFEYDNLGRLVEIKDALSRLVNQVYDALSRLIRVEHPAGQTAGQGFDKDNNLTSVSTPVDNTRTHELDENANVIAEATEDLVTLDFQYNENNLLKNHTNGRGQTTTYQYDDASRLINKVDDLATRDYQYDANGNLLTLSEGSDTITRQYDGFNRVVQYQENSDDQRKIKYGFDLAGNLTQLTYPATAISSEYDVNYTYDSLNRITDVSVGAETLSSYQYDAKGRMTQLVRGNGSVVTLTYDAADRLTSSTDKDKNGNIILEQNYTYDALGRLTQENILPESSPPSGMIQSVSMSYGLDNRISTKNGETFDFDADGNIVKAEGLNLTFNARNQLVQAGDTTYRYNAEGNRTELVENQNSTEVSYSYLVNPHYFGLPQVIRTQVEADESQIQDYIYGTQGLIAQYNHTATDQDVRGYHYFHYDYRGSLLAVSNPDGEVVARFGYLPYGQQYPVSGSFDTPFAYNARDSVVADKNGLIYMRARYYSPDQHRFLSKDPLRGEITDLGSLNRYAYVGGDPVNLVDPSGFISNSAFAGSTLPKSNETINVESKLTRVSLVSSLLMSNEEATSAVNYACNKSSFDCSVATTSYVIMEACYGTAEFLVPVGKINKVGLVTKGPTLEVSRSSMPKIAGNIENAIQNGAPTILNRVTSKSEIRKNRREALRGQKSGGQGNSLDEYPFASCAQGGAGSCVKAVPATEQSIQGGKMSQFYQRNNIGDGDAFNVKVVD